MHRHIAVAHIRKTIALLLFLFVSNIDDLIAEDLTMSEIASGTFTLSMMFRASPHLQKRCEQMPYWCVSFKAGDLAVGILSRKMSPAELKFLLGYREFQRKSSLEKIGFYRSITALTHDELLDIAEKCRHDVEYYRRKYDPAFDDLNTTQVCLSAPEMAVIVRH